MASELLTVARGTKLGDFIYDGGPVTGHGVALVEAKGSLSAAANRGYVAKRAAGGYKAQVELHLGKTSTAGKIVHGYAVGIGAVPRSTAATSHSGATSHVVETAATSVAGPAPPGPGSAAGSPPTTPMSMPAPPGPGSAAGSPPTTPVSTSMAFGNYRAVFMLANAPVIYDHLDRLTKGAGLQSVPEKQVFECRKSGDLWFLVGRNPRFQHTPPGWPDFAIEGSRGVVSQPASTYLMGNVTPTFNLPTHNPVLAPPTETPSKQPYVLFPDGFALLLDWAPPTKARIWSKGGGLAQSQPLPTDTPVPVS